MCLAALNKQGQFEVTFFAREVEKFICFTRGNVLNSAGKYFNDYLSQVNYSKVLKHKNMW